MDDDWVKPRYLLSTAPEKHHHITHQPGSLSNTKPGSPAVGEEAQPFFLGGATLGLGLRAKGSYLTLVNIHKTRENHHFNWEQYGKSMEKSMENNEKIHHLL